MVTERVIKLLSEQYDMDASALSADSSFEEMSFDSLDVAEMVMTLEDEYKISIEMSGDLKTIGALAAHIEEKLKA